jgi:DNA repair exonuclease SbcCD ATPase subunit
MIQWTKFFLVVLATVVVRPTSGTGEFLDDLSIRRQQQEMQAKLDELLLKVDNIQTPQADMQSVLGTIMSKLVQLESKMGYMETKLDSLSDQNITQSVLEVINNLNEKVDKLWDRDRTALDVIEEALLELQIKVNNFPSLLDNLSIPRLDDVQLALTDIQGNLLETVNFNLVDLHGKLDGLDIPDLDTVLVELNDMKSNVLGRISIDLVDLNGKLDALPDIEDSVSDIQTRVATTIEPAVDRVESVVNHITTTMEDVVCRVQNFRDQSRCPAM